MISASNDTVTASLSSNFLPLAVAYDSGRGEVFVANYASSSVEVISASTDSLVTSIHLGTIPLALAFDASKGEVFAASVPIFANYPGTVGYNGTLSVIPETANTVANRIPLGLTGAISTGIAYDPGVGEIFVTNNHTNSVQAFSDTTNASVATIPVGIAPFAAVYDSGRHEIFVANAGSNSISVISDSNDSVAATINLGSNYQDTPTALAYDPSSGEVFVANESHNLSVISDMTNTVVKTIELGFQVYPVGMVYDSSKGELFVASQNGPSLTVVSTRSNSVVGTIDLGGYATGGMAYDANSGEILVNVFIGNFPSNLEDNSTVFISDSTDQVVAVVRVGDDPVGIAIDPATSRAYVANYLGGTISILSVPPSYNVTFTERGLPARTLDRYGWSVELEGLGREFGPGATSFTTGLPNGTYRFLVTGPRGYRVVNSTAYGAVSVSGGSANLTVDFSRGATDSLSFHESGSTNNSTWCFAVVPPTQWCNNARGVASIENLTPGTYPYAITTPTGMVALEKVGSSWIVQSAGNVTLTTSKTVQIRFGYPVSFEETGLTGVFTWSITSQGIVGTSSTSTVVLVLTNGNHAFSVHRVVGYRATPASGHVLVSGASPTPVTIRFSA